MQAQAAAAVREAATICILPVVAALTVAASVVGMPGKLSEVAAELRGIVTSLLAVQPAPGAARDPAPLPVCANPDPTVSTDVGSATALARPAGQAAEPLVDAEAAAEWVGVGTRGSGRLVRAGEAAESELSLLEGTVGRGTDRVAVSRQEPAGEPEASCRVRASSSLDRGGQGRWAEPDPAAGSPEGLAPDTYGMALPSEAYIPQRCQSPTLPRQSCDADRPAGAERRSTRSATASAAGKAASGSDENADAGVKDLMGVRRLSTGESSAIGAGSPRREALGALVRTGASGCSWGSGGAESLGAAESPGAAPAAAEGSPMSMRGAGSARASARSTADAFLEGLAPAVDGKSPAAADVVGQTQGFAPGAPPAQDLAGARRAWAALMVRLSLHAHEQVPGGALLCASAAWGHAHRAAAPACAQHALAAEAVDAAAAAAGCKVARDGLLKEVSALLQQARLAEGFPGCVHR